MLSVTVMAVIIAIVSTIVLGYIITSVIFFFLPHLVHAKKQLKFVARHISHRGGAGENLESTLSAFKHAVAMETEMLEIDTQLSKDGHVVVSHDDDLKRVTGQDVRISETDFENLPMLLPDLELYSQFGYVHVTEGNGDRRIITLRELFKEFPNTPINVDVKVDNDLLIEKVRDLIAEFNREEITVWGNKSATVAGKCYKANPRIPLMFSLKRIIALVAAFYTGLLPFLPLKEHCLEISIPRMYLRDKRKMSTIRRLARYPLYLFLDLILMNRLLFFHLKKRGIRVFLWVINTEEQYALAKHYNVSGIITDFPSKFHSH